MTIGSGHVDRGKCETTLKLEAEAQCLYTVEEVGQEVTKKELDCCVSLLISYE